MPSGNSLNPCSMEPSFRKVLQKKIYDIVSHKYGLLLVFAAFLVLIVSALHFGEAALEWSSEKYAAVFNSFSDNVVGKSFRDRLCLPVPIDVVYTWVNGSDPKLLRELRREKAALEKELNVTKEVEVCTFSNCLPAPMVVVETEWNWSPSLEELQTRLPQLSSASQLWERSIPEEDSVNMTVLVFDSNKQVTELMNQSMSLVIKNITFRRTFYTTDHTLHHSLPMTDTVLMTGFPHKYTKAEELKEKLPESFKTAITKMELNTDKGIAVLTVPDKKIVTVMTETKNISMDGKNPTFITAHLLWDLRDVSKDEDVSASRFEDNEELRYSLRSIERFAPWVRHIYIVTNGQIPYWLQMDSPRVTLVTHQEIFQNESHLPTFSSPAIESHLHRIPGLSDKFIYLNDDVMFGKEVWPDDFYTYSSGQKVYLTWPVPNCNEGCPSTWIKDGYCDKACNTSDCDWDGGDCTGGGSNVALGAGYHNSYSEYRAQTLMYCNTGCANSWVADKYCDQACNVRQCAFDAGDCGTDSYDQMPEIPFSLSKDSYCLPSGEFVGYFNLSDFMSGNVTIEEALYSHKPEVRAVAVAQKFKVLTFVLQEKSNKTDLHFTIKAQNSQTEEKIEFNFTLTAHPSGKKNTTQTVGKKKTAGNDTKVEEEEAEEDMVVFEEVPLDRQQPHIQQMMDMSQMELPFNLTGNLSALGLDPTLLQQLSPLREQYFSGELTYAGLRTKSFQLYQRFQHMALAGQGQNGNMGRLGRHLSSVELWQTSRQSWQAEDDAGDREFLQMVKARNMEEGRLPWERRGTFLSLMKESVRQKRQSEYERESIPGRRLLDTFGDSLRHVNRIYNKAFGFSARKVPAHMPHMIDKHIMEELQQRFPEEWDVTSSHRVRHSQDMQYAFAYFYYLMGVTENVTTKMIFDELDTDKSRTLSDREIRTLAARLYELPLYLELLTGLESMFQECATNSSQEEQQESPPAQLEMYFDKNMPQVTRSLFLNCPNVTALLEKHFKPRGKYRYNIVDDSEVAFKMIRTNVSGVVSQLDDIRKNPKKFICLNDNIEHSKEEGKTVKAILQDFYESMFPMPSQFELPREYRNRFLHIDELREWRKYRDWLRFWTHLALVILVLFAIASFFGDKIEALQRRYTRRRNGEHEESPAPPPEGLLISV